MAPAEMTDIMFMSDLFISENSSLKSVILKAHTRFILFNFVLE